MYYLISLINRYAANKYFSSIMKFSENDSMFEYVIQKKGDVIYLNKFKNLFKLSIKYALTIPSKHKIYNQITELNINNTKLKTIPDMPKLRVLQCYNTKIYSIPNTLKRLKKIYCNPEAYIPNELLLKLNK